MITINQESLLRQKIVKGAKRLGGGLVLAGGVLLWSSAAPAAPTFDSLGYTFRAPMTNSGVETGASGTVLGSENRRGSTDKQRLAVKVSKLHANTPYRLVAYTSGSVTSSIAADFTTDRRGGSLVTFVKGQTRGGHQLPAVMDPISDLSALAIVNGNGDTVLRSQLTDPAAFSYSVRRSMDNTGFLAGAAGLLLLNGNTHIARVSVIARQLTPRTPYRLTVNGVDATTKTSSRAGTLSLSGPKVGLPLVLDIRTVAVAESTGTNIILIASGLGIPSVVPNPSPAPVALGAAANYGALAGSTVTSSGATVVHGDLGVSPGTAVTGFPPGTVTGAIHAGDSAAAQAQLDLTVAYNDAAGRTSNAVSVAGNLGGLTLTPGLYKSTSSLEISSGDLTLDAQGVTNAVFIFQIASSLTTTSGRQVILSGGAQAANIIWQVGSSATLGTSSIFKGNILALTAISVATGATVEGRLLARNAAVTFDGNIVGNIPADTTAPTVSSMDPVGFATGTAINKKISAAFSERMDPATINTATFSLWQGETPVSGTMTYVGTTAVFAPDSSLATNTTYIAAITGGATDLAGNSLANTAQWSFTTGASLDATAPSVNFIAPAAGASSVAPNTKIAATFSEGMDPATINTTNFTLSQGATPVAGTVAYSAVGRTATFSPANTLAPLTGFTATIATGTRDLAGNPVSTNFVWSFTTGEALDTNATVVVATVPANAATGVPTNQSINVTFNAPMDPSTINAETFVLAGPGPTPVPGIVAYDAISRIATFAPSGALTPDTAYTVTITTGAKDLVGNGLAANLDWGFTTAAIPPGQPPVDLGVATPFAVLAGSTVTSSGATAVTGDLGLSPGTAVTGFPPGTMNGAIHAGDSAAALAQFDLNTAYNEVANRTVNAVTVAGNLGGMTLTPGLYKSTSSLEVSSGDLTLDAQGDVNAVFIFQMASTLTTTSGRQVVLSGGAKAANVFWQVGTSATLGTTSVFKGTILADQSVTLNTGAALEGRALARVADVTMGANTITIPTP